MSEIEPTVLLLSGPFAVRGSCSYSLRLAEHLPSNGFRSSVICPDASRVDADLRRELHICEYSHLNLPLWGRIVLRMILRQLQLEPPDLIHIQARNALPQGIWLARQLRCPFVLTVHDYLQPHERLHVDRQWCQRIIAVSEAVKTDLLERTNLPDELITVIHSGMDADKSINVAPVFKSDRIPVVGAAGPLEAAKGFPFFLGAAARVLATGRDVEFIIAGAGPEESNLRRLACELKIDHKVTFAPNLLEFDEAILAMDIFCLPSLQQGIGTIMIQAMAMGRPVIATRVGGVYRVVRDGETGFLVPPSSSEALSRRILELLDNPTQASVIGQSAREEVMKQFNVEQMVSKTVSLYREIIANSPAEETSTGVLAQ